MYLSIFQVFLEMLTYNKFWNYEGGDCKDEISPNPTKMSLEVNVLTGSQIINYYCGFNSE